MFLAKYAHSRDNSRHFNFAFITINTRWLVTAWYGDLQSACSLVGREDCVNCCVCSMVFSESRNYVIRQVAGLKPLQTNRHDCSAFRVYDDVYE
jgi:hypothetical protein